MYPDFSYLFHKWFGTDPDNWLSLIKTFGFFLAMAFVAAGIVVHKELRRKAADGLLKGSLVRTTVGAQPTLAEAFFPGLLGFFLGYKIPYIISNLAVFKADAASIILSPSGNFLGGIIGALLIGAFWYWDRKRLVLDTPKVVESTVYPHDKTGDLIIAAAISGIIGSKLFAIVDPEIWPEFVADPVGTFFSGSGMAFFGGLIGGFLFIFWYCKRKKIAVIHIMDAAAPALILAYGVGRLGCHFSGDGDWGIVSELANKPAWMSFLPDWLYAYDYPNNVINSKGHEFLMIEGCEARYCTKLSPMVYPTSVYEFLMALVIFAILWSIRKRVQIAGGLFSIYLIFVGIERFFIERFRVNESYNSFGVDLTQAEIIALILIVLGIGFGLLVRQRHKAGKPILF